MPRFELISRALFASLALLLVFSNEALVAQLPEPSNARPLFQDRPFGPRPAATPTPVRKARNLDDEKPIPIGWILGGIAAAALATVGLLYGSQRAWRSSNLFDRQYRFPVDPEPALRLGGNKCGGHMATISFAKNESADP